MKFLKAAERVKLVPPTTHMLGQGGIPGLKAAFVSTLPLLQFFLQRFVSVESHRTVWDTFCDANCIAKMCQMAFSSQRYDSICFANYFARDNMRKSALRKRVRRLEQIANCFASQNMRRSMRFFLPVVLWGQNKRYKRKITAAENDNGPGAWQGASF